MIEKKLTEAKGNSDSDPSVCFVNIRKLYGIFQDFEGRQSDSEQKILSFLAESLDNFPAYWSVQLTPLLRNAITEAEDYYNFCYANKLTEMERESIINAFNKLKSMEINNSFSTAIAALHKRLDFVSSKSTVKPVKESTKGKTKAKAKGKTDKQKEVEEVEVSEASLDLPPALPKRSEENKEQALKHINCLDKQFKRLKSLRANNPCGLSEVQLQKLSMFFENIGVLADRSKVADWKDAIDYIKENIISAEELYPRWVQSFSHFIKNLPPDKTIEGIVLHLHSWRDICEFCAVSLAREAERNNGFVAKLKSICMASTGGKTPPFFRILASCSECRYSERKTKYRDEHSGNADYLIPIAPQEGEKAIFFQKHFLPIIR